MWGSPFLHAGLLKVRLNVRLEPHFSPRFGNAFLSYASAIKLPDSLSATLGF